MRKRVAGVLSHLFLDFLQRSRCLFFGLAFMVSQSGTIIEVLFPNGSGSKGQLLEWHKEVAL